MVTGKARSGIRGALKMQQVNESIVLGRRLIDRALSNLNSRMNLVPADNIKQVLTKAKLDHLDELLAEVGLGNQMASVVARRLLENQASLPEDPTRDLGPLSIKPSVRSLRTCLGKVVPFNVSNFVVS